LIAGASTFSFTLSLCCSFAIFDPKSRIRHCLRKTLHYTLKITLISA
jgi:hypothetical protein